MPRDFENLADPAAPRGRPLPRPAREPDPFYYVSVYRDADFGDCTNGGVTAQFKRAILCRKGHLPPVAPAGYAVLVLDEEPIMNRPRIRAVPAGETRWVMFGGNFVWSCDSRFRQEVSELPIPVHDRIEA